MEVEKSNQHTKCFDYEFVNFVNRKKKKPCLNYITHQNVDERKYVIQHKIRQKLCNCFNKKYFFFPANK